MNIPTTTFVQQAPNQNDEGLYRVWFNQIGSFINGAQAVKENSIIYNGEEVGKTYSVRIGALVLVSGVLNQVISNPVIGVTYNNLEILPVAPMVNTSILLCGTTVKNTNVIAGQYTSTFTVFDPAINFSVCYIAELKKR